LISIIRLDAQSGNYSVDLIPDSLRKNAKSVIREEITEFELIDLSNCRLHTVQALTVFDKGGEDHLTSRFFYSKLVAIDQISLTIYDKDGIRIRSLGRKDLIDKCVDPYGTLYSDYRYLELTTAPSVFPYTIKYEVVYSLNVSYNFPDWHPLSDYDQSIQHGTLKITVPEGYKFQYKQSGLSATAKESVTEGKRMVIWEIYDLPAIEREAFAPNEIIGMPRVMIIPSDFMFEGYKGNMSSWKEFGKFIYTLTEGQNDISPQLKQRVREMTAGISDPLDKVRVLYKYLQNTTRYVSIQVGIGGMKPFPASSVEKNGYGDCKALSNYMKSLLEAVNIKSYCSIIEAGKYHYFMDTSFVHDPFDHEILYVPLRDQEVWLECTSQIIPFGFLGDFTDNRYAMLITENGGILKKTRDYAGECSKKISVVTISLNTDPSAKAQVKTNYAGLYYDDILSFLHLDYEKKKDYLYDFHTYNDHHLNIPDFKIASFSYFDSAVTFPQAVENLDLELINYTSISGLRMFVPLKLSDRSFYIPKKDPERVNPIEINGESWEYDSTCIILPEGYVIEFLPGNDGIKNCFGEMSVSISTKADRVFYVRRLRITRNTHSRESYEDFIQFCKYINKLDNLKLVLVKKS